MSPAAPDWDAIARYLAGEASASEATEVARWLETHPEDAKAIAALDAAIGRHAPAASVDVEAALHKVKTRLARRTPRQFIAVAGAAAAAAAVVAVLFLPPASGDRVGPVAETRYATDQGARDTVTLSDGTRVMLGPSTRIAINGRNIDLQGEAFFTMGPETNAPYLVRANAVTIRDIGTEFGVRAYPNEPVRIVVSSGIVEVSSSAATVVLDSGDVAVAQAGGSLARSADAVTDDDVAWMQGRLVLRNATMRELRADLQRWYGVELRVTDSSLQRRHFTGSFAGEPVSRIANVIALALGARAELRGDTILLRR